MSGDMVKSRPHTPTFAEPSCLMTSDAAPLHERHDLLAVEVGAPVGGVHLEPGVERGDRAVALVVGICEPHGFGPAAGLLECRRCSSPAATWCRATSGPCSTRCAPRRAARTSCRRPAARPRAARSAATRPRSVPTVGRGSGDASRRRRKVLDAAGRWWRRVRRGRRVADGVLHLDRRRLAAGRRRVVRVPPPFDRVHDAVAAVVADPLDACVTERVSLPGRLR